MSGSNLAIHAVTPGGLSIASRLGTALAAEVRVPTHLLGDAPAGAIGFSFPMREALAPVFPRYRGHVFIMAIGAVVRMVSPLLGTKWKDPAVVCVDEAGRFAVSVLSGHAGGANDLAERVAVILGGRAVVTTASDALGTVQVDRLGRDLGWTMEDPAGNATRASAAIVGGAKVLLVQEVGEPDFWPADRLFPDNIAVASSLAAADPSRFDALLLVTDRLPRDDEHLLFDRAVLYRPRSLAVGLGCDRGTSPDLVARGVAALLSQHRLALASVREIGTIELKRDEPALASLAERLGRPLRLFSQAELESVRGVESVSETVRRHVGTGAVAEPAALLSSRAGRLVVPRQIYTEPGAGRSMTLAAARFVCSRRMASVSSQASSAERPGPSVAGPRARNPGASPALPATGSLAVVGIGPGARDQMTGAAREAIASAEVVIGYTAYLDLLGTLASGKKLVAGGMGSEIARAREAVDRARRGARVALVSSGDAGIYGMAGPVLKVLREAGWQRDRSPRVTVVPGVTALSAAAALAGAPLGHDFCAISLSDLLTPWATIARRIEAAAGADFVLALYNPASAGRRSQLAEARRILLRHRSGPTPVAVVTNAYRAGARCVLTDLDRFLEEQIGMTTTLLVGSSESYAFEGFLITPRGYGERDGCSCVGAPGAGRDREEG